MGELGEVSSRVDNVTCSYSLGKQVSSGGAGNLRADLVDMGGKFEPVRRWARERGR